MSNEAISHVYVKYLGRAPKKVSLEVKVEHLKGVNEGVIE